MLFNNKLKVVALLLLVLFLFSTNVAADGHILVFHRFADARYPSTNITKKQLTNVFDYLENNNYQVVKLEQMVNWVKNNQAVPDKTVALTIDDGYRSFYDHGLDIFKSYDYPFTMFINTKPINQGYSDFLTWEQVKEIDNHGTIASHGYDHPHLTTLSKSEIKEDVKQSIDDIEENLGKKPDFFSYPYGEYNKYVKNTVRGLGFKAVFNQNLGAVAQESDSYDINRIAVSEASELDIKLAYDYLPAKWISRDEMVTDGRVTRVKVEVAPEIEKAQLYVSGHGWRRVELEQGTLDLELDLELKYSRNRIFLKTYDNKLSGKLIMK
ncbi:polysaccharide deacetylase family protein [Halanaerobacter jeridensis]|uniref:Peptidoglycan/xylan/chitin deacetylase (PgdA/CDA1 family) n=1 Tax=Halanaerobacter jeridensis TaxID=706427 RepID=A0A938XT67_9FIRM|nr:polysaccharide deacetylase family protein [Halanaerobacter jeridensis]MBM7555866.1 peptidoglycan/xylan/chitin deacetylase (PgdA/CDA1 family) [Halanaerobacter jeridensis]